jgi:glycine/D-amino acid oxidase-like deaminating enzyme
MDRDWVVVGHGLAGAAVAWYLRERGAQVLVVDDGGPAASRVAAGLVSPVTGPRLAPVPRWTDLWPAAVAFYERVETATGRRFFHRGPQVRVFADDDMRTIERRTAQFREPDPPLDPENFDAPFGATQIEPAGRLDAPSYLDASRSALADADGFHVGTLDPSQDVNASRDAISFPRLGIRAGGVVFCQGFAPGRNQFFPRARIAPLQGEVLTVRVPGLPETRVVYGGVWLVPLGDGRFRVGATHDRTRADNRPTDDGREKLLKMLRIFLRQPFEVVRHEAGVRPATADTRPVLGVHPEFPRVGFFNGLGSKGVLLAPFYAAQLVAALTGEGRIDPDVDVRRFDPPGGPVRVAELAHAAVRAAAGPGETVVDATAGNGRDTVFLAGLVGAGGRVIAFDVQPLALERTRRRLAAGGFRNVVMHLRDHAELAAAVPGSDRGRVGAVMFNLGFLPGGDRARTTSAGSTVRALESALEFLRAGGVATVIAYPASSSGAAEADAVRRCLNRLPPNRFMVREVQSDGLNPGTPILFVVRRES